MKLLQPHEIQEIGGGFGNGFKLLITIDVPDGDSAEMAYILGETLNDQLNVYTLAKTLNAACDKFNNLYVNSIRIDTP